MKVYRGLRDYVCSLLKAAVVIGLLSVLSSGFAQVLISQTGTTSTNTNNMISYRLKVWNRGSAVSGATVNFTAPNSLVNINWYCRGFGPTVSNTYQGAFCGTGTGEQNRNGSGNLPSFVVGNLPTNNVATPPTSGSYIEITVLGTVASAGSLTSSAATVTSGGTTNSSGTVSTTTVTVTPNFCTDAGGTRGANRFDDNGSFGILSGTPTVIPPTLGGALPLGRTTYSYVTISPEDGEYNLTNSIRYRTDFAWHYPNGHTTGQTTDLMIGVNASYQPGVFYEQTITVTPNTIHDFSAWVANLLVNPGIRPNLEFEIDRIGLDDDGNVATGDGNEGQTIAVTGDIPESTFVTWLNYGAFVNSGGASQITVRLRNNAPGGGGNDLVLDDFFFAPCSVSVGYVTGFVYPDVDGSNAKDNGEGGLDGITVYLYNAAGTTLITSTKTSFDGSYTFTVPPGTYTVRVQNADPALPSGATLGTPNDLAATVTTNNTTSGKNFGFDLAAISGTVFEDVTYGGGVARNYASAFNAVPRPNVRLEVYNSSGKLVTTLFTDSQGRYSYAPGAGTYYLRVVNSFVTSSRGGACSLAANVSTLPQIGSPAVTCPQLPVQIYRTDANSGTAVGVTNEVGGRAPSLVDAGMVTTTGTTLDTSTGALTGTVTGQAQTFTKVVLATVSSRVLGVDFGFNFDTIVNKNGTGQGSLAQFIVNSNALNNSGLKQDDTTNTVASAVTKAAGKEVSIFMIPSSQAVGGVFTIAPTTSVTTPVVAVLPVITDGNTTINGATQTAYTGNTSAATADVTTGPEIILDGSAVAGGPTLAINGANTTLANLGITGSRTSGTLGYGVHVRANNFTMQTSTVYSNQGSGVQVDNGGASALTNGSITGSIIRNNGTASTTSDGISLDYTNTWTISGNSISANAGSGIDLVPRAGGGNSSITIATNTIFGNGTGATTEKAGIAVRQGSTVTIDSNTIRNNTGDGVVVVGGNSSTDTLITKNSIYSNGSSSTSDGNLGIDLSASTSSAADGDGVTINDNTDSDTGANTLLNFPILEGANFDGTNLILTGFARPGSIIELFSSSAVDPSNFGEGQTYVGSYTEGSGADGDATTGTYGPAAVNGVAQGTDNTNRFRFTIPLASFPAFTATSVLTATATIGNNTSEFSGRLGVYTLSGMVFEDVNYGGGLGRSLSGSGGAVRPDVRVELYSSVGNFVSTTTTNVSGLYSFLLPGGSSYTVRIVSNTVSSSRTGGCATPVNTTTCTQLPVQTFRTSGLTSNVGTPDTGRVGGEDSTKVDALANSSSATLASLTTTTTVGQSVTTVALAASNATGIDFGFNFDTIVSTRDAGQGSLRQFILNSNALGGEASLVQSGSRLSAGVTEALPSGKETSIFMISNGVANPGLRAGLTNQLASGVAVITPSSLLDALTGTNAPNTILDGTTQSQNVRVSSGGAETNAGVLGNGGTVGVDALTLSQVQRPEVQVVGSTSYAVGLDLQASNLTVRGIAIYGFGNASNDNNNTNIRIGNTYTTTLLEQNMIGTPATSFDGSSVASGMNPCGGVRSMSDNIRSLGADDGIVRNNLIGWAAGKGFGVENGSQRWLIENNEIRCNAIGNPQLDAIDLENGTTSFNTVRGNLLWQNEGVGADGYQSGGNNAVINNTIRQNGIGGPNETPGVRMYGPNNMVIKNIIESNYGAGIMATCQTSCASINTFSLNSIFDNGEIVNKTGTAASAQIGIDLLSNAEGQTTGVSPFVTKNDSGDTDTGANDLYNFPVFESAEISGSNLILKGFSRSGAVIELFIANDDASGFGEGQTYKISLREGGTGAGTTVNGVNVDPTADADATTGTYNDTSTTGPGTDTTNRFQFTIALPSGISIGTTLTTTATLLSGSSVTIGGTSYQTGTTSEFSKLVTVTSNVKLGLAKTLDRIVHSNNATDNAYTLVYRLTLENFSSSALSSLVIYDDVATQFSGLSPTNYNTWVNVPANAALLSPTGTLTRSGTWNGTSSSNILSTGQSLAANTTGIVYISFEVTVNPAAASPNNRLRDNSATTQATTPSSTVITDTSTNGTDPDGTNNDNNPNESVVTPAPFVKLVKKVRNCGNPDTCSAPGVTPRTPTDYGVSITNAKPSDMLEYQIVFYNLSSQNITGLTIGDFLQNQTPTLASNVYASNTEVSVQCPNTTPTTTPFTNLDQTNAAVTFGSAVDPIDSVTKNKLSVNIMAATACNLTQVTLEQQGQVLFKVKIP
jgi:hypothetical protein